MSRPRFVTLVASGATRAEALENLDARLCEWWEGNGAGLEGPVVWYPPSVEHLHDSVDNAYWWDAILCFIAQY